jgi:hypothetical protein
MASIDVGALYSIRFDVHEYFKRGDLFKSMKRLFAFFKLKGGNQKDMDTNEALDRKKKRGYLLCYYMHG